MRLVGRRLSLSSRVLALALVALIVTGCYMPLRFDAEISIDREGYYSMIFDGYMTRTELFREIKQGKLTKPEIAKRIAVIREDLTRDPSVTQFKYYRDGVFKVHWARKGDLLAERDVTFVRRNERILDLSYNHNTGQITLLGKSLDRDVKNRLRAAGLDTSGQIRVFSNAHVTEENASYVKPAPQKGPGWKLYVWNIKNLLAPTPSLIITLQ